MDSITAPLEYSSKFNFPLTSAEIWYWQISTKLPPVKINHQLKKYFPRPKSNYYFLPKQQHTVALRQQNEIWSKSKWVIARHVSQTLSHLPTIQAIFITGSLAMNNCPKNDDIDIMIVTSPQTLWLTRFLVASFLQLKSYRRPTRLDEHSSPRVRNKICDNLYLDSNQLLIPRNNLYTSHEILQAKCIFDRANIHSRFIRSNPWVKKYLPVAYSETLKSLPVVNSTPAKSPNLLAQVLNYLFFLVQYLYMKPKITNETITLHAAFFHPRKYT